MNHSTLGSSFRWQKRRASPGSKTAGPRTVNITTRIQQLEEGLPLSSSFAATKMVLSPAGVQFLSYARRITGGGRGKAGSASDNPGGSLRLGAMEATAASRLPPLLTRFQQQCPQVDITLITQPTRQLTEGC